MHCECPAGVTDGQEQECEQRPLWLVPRELPTSAVVAIKVRTEQGLGGRCIVQAAVAAKALTARI